MNRSVCIYLVVLFALIVGWLALHLRAEPWQIGRANAGGFAIVTMLYFASHLVRMIRLMLLTLAERKKALPLASAHALTAFPSSFMPYKIGEVFRLTAFVYVIGTKREAFAVWLIERFGDVFIITIFIMGLYLFDVRVPESMQAVFVIFVLVTVFGLISVLAVTHVLAYLNHHLVLTSHSKRGLRLLQASYGIRLLEKDIRKTVEGRVTGVVLLSAIIWVLEIVALSMFIKLGSAEEMNFVALFTAGLLASLPGRAAGESRAFGAYQSVAMVVLALVFLVVLCIASRLKSERH